MQINYNEILVTTFMETVNISTNISSRNQITITGVAHYNSPTLTATFRLNLYYTPVDTVSSLRMYRFLDTSYNFYFKTQDDSSLVIMMTMSGPSFFTRDLEGAGGRISGPTEHSIIRPISEKFMSELRDKAQLEFQFPATIHTISDFPVHRMQKLADNCLKWLLQEENGQLTADLIVDRFVANDL